MRTTSAFREGPDANTVRQMVIGRSAGLVAGVMCSLAGAAESIPVVTVTPDGPDQSIPVGGTYYLQGAVTEASVDLIQPVIVRKSRHSLISWGGGSCSELDLAEPIAEAFRPEQTASRRVPASELWKTGGVGREAFLPAPWVRRAPTDNQFKIFVDGKDDYFTPAGSFCLFIYKRSAERKTDATTIKAMLLKAADAFRACSNLKGDSAGACRGEAEKARNELFTGLAAKVAPAAVQALKQKAASLEDATTQLVLQPQLIEALLEGWAQNKVIDTTRKPDASEAVRQLLLRDGELLSENGELVVPGNPPIKFDTLLLGTNGQIIAVRGAMRKVLERKTSELLVPGAPEVTVRDLIELANGMVRLDDGYVTLRELKRRVHNELVLLEQADEVVLSLAQRRISTLNAALLQLLQTDDNDLVGRALAKAVEPLLVPCNAAWLSGMAPDPKMKLDCGEGEGWPKYKPQQSVPGYLERSLRSFLKAQRESRAVALEISTLEIKQTLFASPIDTKVAFSQRLWFFSFVTPVLGFAVPAGTQSTFTLNYTALQLTVVPNPVDAPQWSQGAWDLLRLFALEIGIGMVTGNFGPDSRFRGPGGLPPVFIGVAVHVIPYTSVSFGGVILERRSSTLPQAGYEIFRPAFFAANVQINVPEIVAELLNKGAKTSAQH